MDLEFSYLSYTFKKITILTLFISSWKVFFKLKFHYNVQDTVINNNLYGNLIVTFYLLFLPSVILFFQPSPVSLSKGLLVANRYTPNPQYSACSAPDAVLVPQLPRDTLCFLQEIGEGCFGKVYKGNKIQLSLHL